MVPPSTNVDAETALQQSDSDLPSLSSSEFAEVQGIFAALEKTSRVFLLYPPNNKIYIDFTEELSSKIQAFLKKHQELVLAIQEDSIEYKERPVYEEENRGRSIAMKLYRDGVRKLVFYEGVTHSEVLDLLDVLTRQPDADSLEDDMVTLLWEKDFSHISYYVLDDPFGDEDLPDFKRELKQTSDDEVAGKPPKQKYIAPKLSTQTLSAVLTINEHDLDAAKSMIAQENARNLRHDLTTLLFELLVIRQEPEPFRNTVDVLGRLIRAYVGTAEMGEAVAILQRFQEHVAANPPKELKEILEKEIEAAGGKDVMKQIAAQFEQPIMKSTKDVSSFLMLLGPRIIPELVSLIPRARNVQVLLGILGDLARKDPRPLVERITDRDPVVARHVIGVVGMLKDENLTSYILPQLRNPAVAVRIETVRALGRLEGTAAVGGLLRAVRDQEYQVRTLALRCIAEGGRREAVTALREIVEDKEFLNRNLYEKQEFYRTLADLEPDRALAMLATILGKRSFFKRAKAEENRVAAASALAYVRDPIARDVLTQHMSSSSKAVREACEMALRRRERELKQQAEGK